MALTSSNNSPAPSVRPVPSWQGATLATVLAKRADAHADMPFLTAQGGQALTFGAARETVARLATMLQTQGFQPGDTLLLRSGRRIEGALMLLGAVHAGLNVCLVPEGFSVRQATDAAVAFAPKLAVDAGDLTKRSSEESRIMGIAANLFTVRLVGCFGAAPDGLVSFDHLISAEPTSSELPPVVRDSLAIHTLHTLANGRHRSVTRTQSQWLSQGLLCALNAELKPSSVTGTGYDPISFAGLAATLIPALMVGCTAKFFDPLSDGFAHSFRGWVAATRNAHGTLPLQMAGSQEFDRRAKSFNISWVGTAGQRSTEALGKTMLADCDGIALLPAVKTKNGDLAVTNGTITLPSSADTLMRFGKIRLEARAQTNDENAQLMDGELSLDADFAGTINSRTQTASMLTGLDARLTEGEDSGPVLMLVSPEDKHLARVGNTAISLAVINRTLGLSGRWQDAGAFAIHDHVLGNRIEVAVQPRFGSADTPMLPTLDQVRTVLSESGIHDAGLPIKLHMVVKVPWKSRGLVDVDRIREQAWSTLPIELDQQPDLDTEEGWLASVV